MKDAVLLFWFLFSAFLVGAAVFSYWLGYRNMGKKLSRKGNLFLAKVTLTLPQGTPLETMMEYVLVQRYSRLEAENAVKNHFGTLAMLKATDARVPFLPVTSKDIDLIPVL